MLVLLAASFCLLFDVLDLFPNVSRNLRQLQRTLLFRVLEYATASAKADYVSYDVLYRPLDGHKNLMKPHA